MKPDTGATLRFVVLGELASGGMGRVDLARRVDGRRELVAVKRIHPHLAKDAEFSDMFFAEARVTGALDHPNVVSLVGFGSDDEGLFLATEFVEGGSLAELFEAARRLGTVVPTDVVAYVAARAAAGLGAAHARQIIHRDVSPSNILVSHDGQVKIADFGVARAAFASKKTATGVVKGKVHYMSPEYARGDAIDGRSDLFSLGVAMYQLLVGLRPFDGQNEFQVMKRVAHGGPIRIADRAPRLDPRLAAMIDGLLIPDPRLRTPQTGEELAARLDGWLWMNGLDANAACHRVRSYVKENCHDQREKLALLLCPEERPSLSETGTRQVMITVATLPPPPAPPSESRPEPRGTRMVAAIEPRPAPVPSSPQKRVAVAIALSVAVLGTVGASVLALTWPRAPVPAVAGSAPFVAPPPPVETPAIEPQPPLVVEAPVESASAPARSVTPESSEPHPTKSRPARVKPKPPARSCTPADFDYPSCLK